MFQLANAIMKLRAGLPLVGGIADSWEITDPKFQWVKTLVNAIGNILVPILAVVAAAGIVWAIVLGVQMARADSTEKREEAKKRLIGLVVGIAILVVLIIFFTTLFPLIMKQLVLPEVAGE